MLLVNGSAAYKLVVEPRGRKDGAYLTMVYGILVSRSPLNVTEGRELVSGLLTCAPEETRRPESAAIRAMSPEDILEHGLDPSLWGPEI